MNTRQNPDNVEAFLFDLNELARRHKATIRAMGYGELHVEANGHKAFVTLNSEKNSLQIDKNT